MSIESTSIENNEIVDKSSHIFPNLRGTKAENVIIAHLNINFLQNKFEPLAKLVRGKVDILIISETKIDDSFHTNQFMIDGYSSPFREDRNSHGGGLLIYIREDIPCKRLKTPNISSDIEGIFIELNLNNNKWLLMGGYNPNNERTTYFFNQISKAIDMYLKDYENIILIGDFNTTIAETTTSDFCQMYNLQNLINETTCYKNPKNPSSIDMILTNRKHSFENSLLYTKKRKKRLLKTIDPSVSFLWSPSFMKETCIIKFRITFKITFPPIYLGSEKVIVPNNV